MSSKTHPRNRWSSSGTRKLELKQSKNLATLRNQLVYKNALRYYLLIALRSRYLSLHHDPVLRTCSLTNAQRLPNIPNPGNERMHRTFVASDSKVEELAHRQLFSSWIRYPPDSSPCEPISGCDGPHTLTTRMGENGARRTSLRTNLQLDGFNEHTAATVIRSAVSRLLTHNRAFSAGERVPLLRNWSSGVLNTFAAVGRCVISRHLADKIAMETR